MRAWKSDSRDRLDEELRDAVQAASSVVGGESEVERAEAVSAAAQQLRWLLANPSSEPSEWDERAAVCISLLGHIAGSARASV